LKENMGLSLRRRTGVMERILYSVGLVVESIKKDIFHNIR